MAVLTPYIPPSAITAGVFTFFTFLLVLLLSVEQVEPIYPTLPDRRWSRNHNDGAMNMVFLGSGGGATLYLLYMYSFIPQAGKETVDEPRIERHILSE